MSKLAITSLVETFNASAYASKFTAHVEQALASKEVNARAPVQFLVDLAKIYGANLGLFPTPNSEVSNDPKAIQPKDMDNPDWYKVPVKNSKGESVLLDTSWYAVFVRSLPAGQNIADMRKKIADVQANVAGCDPTLRAMSPPRLETEANRWRVRENSLVNLARKAIMVRNQMTRIVDELPLVGCDFMTDTLPDGTMDLIPTSEPVYIFERIKQVNAKPLSVSTLLKLDIDAAKAKGGTYLALLETVAREPGGKADGEKGSEVPAIDAGNVAKYSMYLAEVVAFMDDTSNWNKIMMALAAKNKAGEFVNNELLLSMDTFTDMVDSIVSKARARIDAERERIASAMGEKVASIA